MQKYALSSLLFLGLAFLVACGGQEPSEEDSTPIADSTEIPTPTLLPATELPVNGEAVVDSVELMIMESFPVQVSVRVRGELPDGCTTIEKIETSQQDQQFNVVISTVRPADAACTQATVPFDETIPLDVVDFPAGTYAVDVNGRIGTFTLEADNTLLAASEPTAAATVAIDDDPGLGIINGTIWHDLCAQTVDENGDTAVTPPGCIADEDGSRFQGDGVFDSNEVGIANITISLGEGACPAVGLATTTTDPVGDYVFTDLAAGNYCVSVDETATANSELLPGLWSSPQGFIAETAVAVADGEIVSEINFGWDYDLLPIADVDLENCTNSIEFVTDLNIPDDSLFAPQTEFVKSWRLRNDGTCPWTSEYQLVHAGGDTVSEFITVPLPRVVAPGETIDLSLNVTAPDAEGTYRSNWQLSDAAGTPFGIGGLSEETFWVQFDVGIPEATPVPSSGAIGGVVWEDVCRITEDGPTQGCEQVEDSDFYTADGSLNFNESRLVGITVILSGDPCPDDGVFSNSAILDTAVTDSAGLYRFDNLDEGVYCVGIDALSPVNVDLLIPGTWTWPALGTGRWGVDLTAGEEHLTIDFGWDYQD